jgi:AraC family transcriptional regulator of adaptative response/methylated-DNA-[protein]-cysteine methyltransferase
VNKIRPQSRDNSFKTAAERWEAVRTKDPRADGSFYFGVRTTGIFCRPSCPSRTPLRSNVTFFSTSAEAEAEGFRPCKRCDPSRPGLAALHREAVTRACRMIQESGAYPGLNTLAKSVGMSPSHFHRVFKAHTGVTPKQFANEERMARMRAALARSQSVTAAIYEAGFGSTSRFYENPALGMAARSYRHGGQGNQIEFVTAHCSLGFVLAAQTSRGLCALFLGDAPEPLERNLRKQFPHATVTKAGRTFRNTLASVVRMIETGVNKDLPLDIRGTAFQRKVWDALRAIPPGTTRSYSEIAEALGMKRGARAVARACASNTLAVVIPCHRVVRNDGDLSGYRWGVERKAELLRREAQSASLKQHRAD